MSLKGGSKSCLKTFNLKNLKYLIFNSSLRSSCFGSVVVCNHSPLRLHTPVHSPHTSLELSIFNTQYFLFFPSQYGISIWSNKFHIFLMDHYLQQWKFILSSIWNMKKKLIQKSNATVFFLKKPCTYILKAMDNIYILLLKISSLEQKKHPLRSAQASGKSTWTLT